MSDHFFRAQAPSNIALIKYMGKNQAEDNVPTNASLSYTLPHLQTFIEAKKVESENDKWSPLKRDDAFSLELSASGKERYLSFWRKLKRLFQIEGQFSLSSANNFPSDCGLASSASSFAALTTLANEVAKSEGKDIELKELARISQTGSGSSCRSFFAPWCLWDKDGVSPIEAYYSVLDHIVVIASEEKKKVSSSQAHLEVLKSLNFIGRPERAEARLTLLQQALKSGDWNEIYQICWSEFWDMHSLFETSQPHFGYMNANSIEILEIVRNIWENEKDGPVVTMDAGANIHLLFREESQSLKEKTLKRVAEQTSCQWIGKNNG